MARTPRDRGRSATPQEGCGPHGTGGVEAPPFRQIPNDVPPRDEKISAGWEIPAIRTVINNCE